MIGLFHIRKPNVFWSRVAGVITVFFPLSLSHIDFRSIVHGGLSVSANRASPAYAAFEDLNHDFKSASEFDIPDGGERLSAGESVDLDFIRQMPRQRLVMLKGMTLKAPAELEPNLIAKPIVVAMNTSRVRPAPLALSSAMLNHDPDSLLAQKPFDVEDLAAVTPAQKAQELIEQEIQAAQIAGQSQLVSQYRLNIEREKARAEESRKEPGIADLATVVPNPDANRPLWLNGQIEMTGGLAYMGPDTHLEVKRVVDGETLERGRIWVTEGRFEIHVKKASGYLVAELQTRNGSVLGRGELNLMQLTEVPRKDNKIEDIRLALRPTTQGVAFQPVSGYSYGQRRIPVADARVEIQAYTEPQGVNDDGLVTEPSLNRNSSFVARAVAKKHWPSLVVGQAHHTQDIRLFSNSLVEALVNLDLTLGMDRKEALHASVVWGQLTRDGQPVEGGIVEMAGSYEAIYFNDLYLPDRNMHRTGKNGLFAFLRVKAGVQALRVRMGGRLYPAQIFPTENKHVSYVELDVRERIVSQFRVFDVLNLDKPVNARIRIVGAENELAVAKNQYVEYSVASDHFMIEAESGPDYETSRMTLTGSPQLVNVPLVKREWLYSLYNHKGVGLIPGRGAIVGFIDDQDFEVELTGYGPAEQMQILYFDGEGKPLETKVGVAGGGFIIFNAPMGLQTLYIHPTQSRETYSQVVVAEPQYVQVVAWAAATASRRNH